MRSAEDFITHFSPRVIMAAIGSDADLRSLLLEQTLGTKRKVGLRKSPTSAGDDLQIALEEGVTSPEAIVQLFSADHRARCLDGAELWAYAIEPEFWLATVDAGDAWSMGRDHIAFILERALAEQLVTARDVVEGLTLALLVHYLPEPVVESVLAGTLRQARIHEPFAEDDLLQLVPPAILAEHLPLVEIWERVVVPCIAEQHGLVAGPVRSPKAPEPSDVVESGATQSADALRPNSGPTPVKMPTAKLVAMPAPKSTGRIALPPPLNRPAAEAEDTSTKRASRAPRRTVPPRR